VLDEVRFDFFTKRPKGRSIKNFGESEALGLDGEAGLQESAYQDADHVTEEAVAGHFDTDEGALFADGEVVMAWEAG
jgi:hypothetical protein